MLFKTLTLAVALACTSSAHAGDMSVMIDDPYARASGPAAKAGAAFMAITNHSDQPDRLIAASSTAAKRVELHTHLEDGDGVMKMLHVEEGFTLAPGETLMLKRGGKHVMLMGLTGPLNQGDTIKVDLTFEKAGTISVEIPVDLTRKPEEDDSGHGDHSGHGGAKHSDS